MEFLRQRETTESVATCLDGLPPTVVDPCGSLSLRRRRRRSRLTPEVMQTEREWTGSPATTVSTTPSPLQFACSPLLSSTPEPTIAQQQQQQRTTRRLLPAQPSSGVDVVTMATADADSLLSPALRRRNSSSTLAENRYFVPISGRSSSAVDAAFGGQQCQSPQQQQQKLPFERRNRSSLSSRRLPAIVDASTLSPQCSSTAGQCSNDASSAFAETSTIGKCCDGFSDEERQPTAPPRRCRSSVPSCPSSTAADAAKFFDVHGSGHQDYLAVRVVADKRPTDVSVGMTRITQLPTTETTADIVNSDAQAFESGNGSTLTSDFSSSSTKGDQTPSADAVACGREPETRPSTAMARVETMKNRFRRLSLLYQNNVQEDSFSAVASATAPSATSGKPSTVCDKGDWLLSTNPHVDGVNAGAAVTPQSTTQQDVHDSGVVADAVTSSVQSTVARAVSEDTDSMSSGGRDEGFESETVGDSSALSGGDVQLMTAGDTEIFQYDELCECSSSAAVISPAAVAAATAAAAADNSKISTNEASVSETTKVFPPPSQRTSAAGLGATSKTSASSVCSTATRLRSTSSHDSVGRVRTTSSPMLPRSRQPQSTPASTTMSNAPRRAQWPTPNLPRRSTASAAASAPSTPAKRLTVKTPASSVDDEFRRGTSARSSTPLHRPSASSGVADRQSVNNGVLSHESASPHSASSLSSSSASSPRRPTSAVALVSLNRKPDEHRTVKSANATASNATISRLSDAVESSPSSRTTSARGHHLPSSTHVDRHVGQLPQHKASSAVRVFSTPVRYAPVMSSRQTSVSAAAAATGAASGSGPPASTSSPSSISDVKAAAPTTGEFAHASDEQHQGAHKIKSDLAKSSNASAAARAAGSRQTSGGEDKSEAASKMPSVFSRLADRSQSHYRKQPKPATVATANDRLRAGNSDNIDQPKHSTTAAVKQRSPVRCANKTCKDST